MQEQNPYAPPQVESQFEETAQAVPTMTVQFEAREADLLAAYLSWRSNSWKARGIRAGFALAALPVCVAVLVGINFATWQLRIPIGLTSLAAGIAAVVCMLVLAHWSNRYFLEPILAKQAAQDFTRWKQNYPDLTFGAWKIFLEPEDLFLQDAAGQTYRFPLRHATITRHHEGRNVSAFVFFSSKRDLLVIPTSARCSAPWPEFDRTLHARCR